MSEKEREAALGRQLRELRLRRNIDQRQLAEQAAVALNAVKNLEGGKGATVMSLNARRGWNGSLFVAQSEMI
ncbi:MAG TPA: hypothetical protein DCZ95_06465 [Verrucomicrobia bacterium]|nr:MAG: hypothetical protein A2X46_16200 [Lentisphaerae bacterium GWF2_57_35]HBA83721.1 hypothetical protein [Verrucomicrobiota bacterium]